MCEARFQNQFLSRIMLVVSKTLKGDLGVNKISILKYCCRSSSHLSSQQPSNFSIPGRYDELLPSHRYRSPVYHALRKNPTRKSLFIQNRRVKMQWACTSWHQNINHTVVCPELKKLSKTPRLEIHVALDAAETCFTKLCLCKCLDAGRNGFGSSNRFRTYRVGCI